MERSHPMISSASSWNKISNFYVMLHNHISMGIYYRWINTCSYNVMALTWYHALSVAAITLLINVPRWGWVTHICVSQLITIVSDNGLSPDRRQAIIWNNDGKLLFGPMGRNFREILIESYTFSFKKMHLKMSSGKWRSSCLGLNVLIKSWSGVTIWHHIIGSTLVQEMACCEAGPSHHLIQCLTCWQWNPVGKFWP